MSSHSTQHLLTPVQVGPYTLENRMVMAPMTRNRAGEGNVPTPLMAEYYTQRAGAGLTGRGGAWFPAGMKWNFLAGAAVERVAVHQMFHHAERIFGGR